MSKVAELREKAAQELKDQIQDLTSELYRMHCELKITRKIDKPHLIKEKRRQRARLLTILGEKGEAGKAT